MKEQFYTVFPDYSESTWLRLLVIYVIRLPFIVVHWKKKKLCTINQEISQMITRKQHIELNLKYWSTKTKVQYFVKLSNVDKLRI